MIITYGFIRSYASGEDSTPRYLNYKVLKKNKSGKNTFSYASIPIPRCKEHLNYTQSILSSADSTSQ